jgi:hypothetical protein
MAATSAPSTVADSPIDEALAKLMGTKGPLSKTAGTNPIGYDPNQTFRPTGDTLNISNLGGSGVSTPEEWTHEIQLANLAQQSAQQEYTKQAAAREFAYKAAQDVLANQRSAAQLGMQQAEAQRARALGPAQLQAAQLGNEQTRQAMAVQAQQLAIQQAAENRQQMEMMAKYGGIKNASDLAKMYQSNADYERFRAGAYISPDTERQYKAYLASTPVVNYTGVGPGYGRPPTEPVWNANAQQWMTAARPTYQPSYGTQANIQRVNAYGQPLKPSSGGWVVDTSGYT